MSEATKGISIRRYMTIASLIDVLRQKKLALLNPDSWDDRNDRLFMQKYKDYKGAAGLYGMCAALRGETYHHWKIFGGGASGACLVLDRKTLEIYFNELQKQRGKRVRYGEVSYLTLEKVKALTPHHIDNLPFFKRYGFRAEREYRVIIETDSAQESAIFIDFPLEAIKAIRLNPWLYDSQVTSLKDTIRDLPGCTRLKVMPSKLINSATWRAVADRMAEGNSA
ncbi:DUF2971 domain-containing protein [Cereibacter sphaeroides]|uniref:DUF2971 domain-containing protein n=1 Tax=Cereibacter sphaeroides TaxID=1063 RepID=UPI0011AE20EB|nr:DUF2971 domain-containing protein [Cereibacter sphaeroides]